MRLGITVLGLLCIGTVPYAVCLVPEFGNDRGLTAFGAGGGFPGFGGDGLLPGLVGGGDGLSGVGIGNGLPGFGGGRALPGLAGGGGLPGLGAGGFSREGLRGSVPNPPASSSAPPAETSSSPGDTSSPPGTTTTPSTETTTPPSPTPATGSAPSTPTCSAIQTLLVGVCVDCSDQFDGCQACITSADNTVICTTCLDGLQLNPNGGGCTLDPSSCGTIISGCMTCELLSTQVVCTACQWGFALDMETRTACTACNVVDNCVVCDDAAGPASTPSAPTDVECTLCSAGFALDLPGPGCADCSDIIGCTACFDANTALQAATPATTADITCTTCSTGPVEMDGSCPLPAGSP